MSVLSLVCMCVFVSYIVWQFENIVPPWKGGIELLYLRSLTCFFSFSSVFINYSYYHDEGRLFRYLFNTLLAVYKFRR